MTVTIQKDSVTGFVVSVVDHGNYPAPAPPKGRCFHVTNDPYEIAREVCGTYHDAVSGKCYKDAGKSQQVANAPKLALSATVDNP